MAGFGDLFLEREPKRAERFESSSPSPFLPNPNLPIMWEHCLVFKIGGNKGPWGARGAVKKQLMDASAKFSAVPNG